MKGTVVAVTMGDPGGVGPEIVLKGLLSDAVWKKGVPVVVGDYAVLERVRDMLGIDVSLRKVRGIGEVNGRPGTVNVLDQEVIGDIAALPVGKVTPEGGRAAFTCIQKAVDLALQGEVMGIVTAPINKEALRAAGYRYPGHTELLAELSGKRKSRTMFMVDQLKIFFHTRHMSLREALETLEPEGVFESIISVDKCLSSIGYSGSRIALAALNPHASDGGLFGNEEERVLVPACRRARQSGVDVDGPVPADSVFHLALHGKYDAVVSLYHDQGHIAAKTYDFFRTVSVTFGLPFMRTSVDHGTAFDIAWKGIANPASMVEALLACFNLAEKYDPSGIR